MPLRARRFADRPRLTGLLLLVAALVVAAGLATRAGATAGKPAISAPGPVPQGFVGVDVDGPMFAPDTPINFTNQLRTMVSSGVQSVRVAFNWAAAQPYRSDADVPDRQQAKFTDVGGVPTTSSLTDMVVGDAARRARHRAPDRALHAPVGCRQQPQWGRRTPAGPRRMPPT